MNKKILLKGLPLALLLASPVAGAESNYPEPFEPKILYQDADLIAKHAAKSSQSAPAQSETPAVSKAVSDPVVVSSADASAPAYTKEESALSQNFPILLLGLGMVGALVWTSKRSAAQATCKPECCTPAASGGNVAQAAAAPTYREGPLVVGTGGETGVSKYLTSLPSPESMVLTGVAKYLRKLPVRIAPEPIETGVTKYLKKLPKPPVLPTDESGVAKYLKSL